jgi:hypothetical protein
MFFDQRAEITALWSLLFNMSLSINKNPAEARRN